MNLDNVRTSPADNPSLHRYIQLPKRPGGTAPAFTAPPSMSGIAVARHTAHDRKWPKVAACDDQAAIMEGVVVHGLILIKAKRDGNRTEQDVLLPLMGPCAKRTKKRTCHPSKSVLLGI